LLWSKSCATHGKFVLEIVEYRRFVPIEAFLGLKHASDQILSVIVKSFANVVHVNAPPVVFAV